MRVNYTTGDKKQAEEIDLGKRIERLDNNVKRYLNGLLDYGAAKCSTDAYSKFSRKYERVLGVSTKPTTGGAEPVARNMPEYETTRSEKKPATVTKFSIPTPPNKSQDQFYINPYAQQPMPPPVPLPPGQTAMKMMQQTQGGYYPYMGGAQMQGGMPVPYPNGMYAVNMPMQQPNVQAPAMPAMPAMPGVPGMQNMQGIDAYQYYNMTPGMNNQQLMYQLNTNQNAKRGADQQHRR